MVAAVAAVVGQDRARRSRGGDVVWAAPALPPSMQPCSAIRVAEATRGENTAVPRVHRLAHRDACTREVL